MITDPMHHKYITLFLIFLKSILITFTPWLHRRLVTEAWPKHLCANEYNIHTLNHHLSVEADVPSCDSSSDCLTMAKSASLKNKNRKILQSLKALRSASGVSLFCRGQSSFPNTPGFLHTDAPLFPLSQSAVVYICTFLRGKKMGREKCKEKKHLTDITQTIKAGVNQ